MNKRIKNKKAKQAKLFAEKLKACADQAHKSASDLKKIHYLINMLVLPFYYERKIFDLSGLDWKDAKEGDKGWTRLASRLPGESTPSFFKRAVTKLVESESQPLKQPILPEQQG